MDYREPSRTRLPGLLSAPPGERLDDVLGDASQRIEEETRILIEYVNNELVPAIRQHSSKALRVASEKLNQFADHMDSTKQK